MAEAAILAALQLLGQALSGELVKRATSQASEAFSIFSDLDVRMNNISSELRIMQAFLDEIDMHDQSSKTHAAWVGEVQKAENQIKDIVDEFIYLVGNQKFGGVSFCLKRIFKSPKSLIALKQIASRLERAEMSLRYVGEMKERWSISNASIGTSTNNANETSIQVAISAHFIDECEIVGIDENRAKLTSLINSSEANLLVISVWGMAGVGKTTLVTNVFKRESKNFTTLAWICISQLYKVDNVLKSIISEVCKNEHTNPINTGTMGTRELKETIRGLLLQKKYLIILDDAWDQKPFHDISDVFVHSQQGSRIVVTSRNADVATLATEPNRLELKPLPTKKSWDLFCRRAFPSELNHKCPSHLEKWAEKILSKCNGLPLALVSLGSVMSSCAKIESEWKRVHDQLSRELETNASLDRLRNVLNLSFNYLPRYLKNCFLYCCMFPEDYLLARKKLIRLWLAEGFVEQRGGCTLEETAEAYILELINRSMLQVIKKNYSGRIKKFRVHDTLRELAISISERENFGLLYGDIRSVKINESVRRLSIVKSGNSIGNNLHLQQLRTLMSFDLSMHSSMLATREFVKCRNLTVLSLENLNIQSVPDNIGDLFNLHYLGLRNTKVRHLPDSIEKLYNLQTLDLYSSKLQGLPDGIQQLKKLRHLFAEDILDATNYSFRSQKGVSLPVGIFHLKELQTIQSVESNDMVVKELGNLTQLTSLKIENVKESQSGELCRSVSNIMSFSYLAIYASNENEFLHLEALKVRQIHKLYLKGRLRESILDSTLFQVSGENIQKLGLRWSHLKHDPLPALSHCKNLTYLDLRRAYEGQQLTFRTGWFPKLKRLALVDMPDLIEVEMEQGTTESLEGFYLLGMHKLTDIPTGIEHLASLKWLGYRGMHAEFGGLGKGTHRLFHFTCRVA